MLAPCLLTLTGTNSTAMAIRDAAPLDEHARVGTTYRAYKRATDRLAGWLATTAQQAVKKGDIKSTDQAPSQGITIAQFTTLTESIIAALPMVEVPLEIVAVAQKAFEARQERATVLKGIDVESDKRHQHVILVIEEVYKKLKAHYQASKRTKQKPMAADLRGDRDLVPSFQLLDVDPLQSDGEESDGARGEQSAATLAKLTKNKKDKLLKKRKKAREASKCFYLDDAEEDPYFVLVCLLKDLKCMRDYVKELWQKYKECKSDLVTVSKWI